MPEPSNLQVVLIGMITVFVCLTVLIALIKLMSAIIRLFGRDSKKLSYETVNAAPVQTPKGSADAFFRIGRRPRQPVVLSAVNTGADRQKLVAAISVAIAEHMGTNVEHIRIVSIKRI